MKKTFVLFSMLLSAVCVMAVGEQKVTTAATDAAKPVDSLKTVELQAVQVRSIRASKKTPMAFTNMNSDQIKQVNHGQDIPFLLSLTPSVTVTSDAGNGIGYTTLRVRGAAAERINITANGVPVNDAESNSVFWVNMGDFASSVQSIQIQRGVGTSTNGAGAFGATINMQTENIGLQPYVGVDLSAGSYSSNKQTVRFSSGLPDGEHWGLQGRLSHIGSKGYIDRAETRLCSYFLQYGYFDDNRAVKFITWNGEEQTYHAWDYASHYAQDTYGRTYNPCGYMGKDANGNDLYYDGQTDNYHQQNYQLVWNEQFSHKLSLTAALH
jgi:iron complex outermembrane receptor protein